MTTFDYLNYIPEYPSFLLKEMLKTIINSDSISAKVEGLHFDIKNEIIRKRTFGEFVRKINDPNLLELVIRYFRIFDLLNTESQILNLFNNSIIPTHKETIVKAYLYGTAFQYESLTMHYLYILDLDNLPTLKFEITDRHIIHNLSELDHKIHRIKLSKLSDFVEGTHTIENQKKYYSSLIKSFSDFDYIRQTEYFTKEIEFLKNRKEGLFIPDISKMPEMNPYPRIFKNSLAHSLFIAYMKNIDKYEHTEYSYIFHKMKLDDLIYQSVTDYEYRNWLAKEYQIIIDKTKPFSAIGISKKDKLYSILKDQITK